MAGKRNRRGFGYIRRLPSRQYQASYRGPDLHRHNAPATFGTKQDAEGWLASEHKLITAETWTPPERRGDVHRAQQLTFGTYAETWLADRSLKPRTRELYRSLLDRRLLPRFGDIALTAITPATVRKWHSDAGEATPTARAHAYGLLKAIMATALSDELIPTNPCHVRGASTAKRRHQIQPPSLTEIEALLEATPPRYQGLTVVAVWTGLRFGEITELRRKDFDGKADVLHVRRAVARVGGRPVVGAPKSTAGIRDVVVPPHVVPILKRHILAYAEPGREGLLFPAAGGGHLAPSSLWRVFDRARKQAGLPHMRWHDLRHVSAVLAAVSGATLSELMTRMGHATASTAMLYQHVAQGRDRQIAEALSAMATGVEQG